jgi:hypothetical protein
LLNWLFLSPTGRPRFIRPGPASLYHLLKCKK